MATRSYENRYYKGKGTAYIEEIGSNTGLIPIGNCSEIALSIETESYEQKDYQNAGGGIADSITNISGVKASVTISSLTPDNIARGLGGSITETQGTAQSGEQHTVVGAETFIPFKELPDTSKTVTVEHDLDEWKAATAYTEGALIKDGAYYYKATVAGTSHADTKPTFPTATGTVVDNGVTWTFMGALPATYTEGVDYELRNSGIYILRDGLLQDGGKIKVTYDAVDKITIQTLTKASSKYRLVYDGLNEAESGNPVRITMHRVQISPADSFQVISDDYATLTINNSLLADPTIKSSGLSKFCVVEMVKK